MEWRQQKRCLILRSKCPPIIIGIQVYLRGLSLAENSETIKTASVHTIPSQSPLLSCVYQYRVDWRLPGSGVLRLEGGSESPGDFQVPPSSSLIWEIHIRCSEIWMFIWQTSWLWSRKSKTTFTHWPRSKPPLFSSSRGSRLFQHSQDGVFYFFHSKYSRLDVVSRPLKYLNVLLQPTVQCFGFLGLFFNSETLFRSKWCARLWGHRMKEAVPALRSSWACG